MNEISVSTSDEEKVKNLSKIQEIVINRSPELLPLYLDETLQFAVDRSAEMRKSVIGFIEEAG